MSWSGHRPLLALVFEVASAIPGSWTSLFAEICVSLGISLAVTWVPDLSHPLIVCTCGFARASPLALLFVALSRPLSGAASLGSDPFPGGRAARHLGSPSSYVPFGDVLHCLSAALADWREQVCHRCSIHLDSASFWVRHPWVFNPSSAKNSMASVLAYVSFFCAALCSLPHLGLHAPLLM